MKKLLLLVAMIVSTIAFGQEEYTITIDGQVMNIEMDKEYEIKIKGKKVPFQLAMKDTLLFDDESFSFNYPKEFRVSRMDIDVGISQFVIMSAEGSGIIIQKYSSMNPTMLNEIMLNEVTKESVNYGFKLDRQDYQRTLVSGNSVEVDKAVLKYKDETNIYELASFGNKDEGIIVMTMSMDAVLGEESQKLISMMWSSLVVK